MFVGALAGFKIGLETGNPWLGLALAMAAGRAAGLAARHRVHPLPGRSDRVRPGADVPGHGHRARPGRRPGELPSTGALLPTLTIPAAVVDPVHRPGVLHRPERPGLRGLPAGAHRLHLDRPHPSRAAPAGRRRAAVRGRRPGRRRLSHALRVHARRRRAGRAGRRDHQHGRHARLVRGPGDVRARLDRGRPRHLRPVEPGPGDCSARTSSPSSGA